MFNFPDIPSVGQVFSPSGGPTWQWDGKCWQSLILMPTKDKFADPMALAGGAGYSTDIFYDGAYTLLNDTTSTQVLVADKIYYTPFRIRELQFFNKIGFNLAAPFMATMARVGIYKALMETSTQYPGELFYDAGEIDVTTSGIKELTIVDPMFGYGKEFAAGEYWLVIVVDGECTVFGSVAPQGTYKFGSSLGPGMPVDLVFTSDHIYGPLPATAGLIGRSAGIFPNMSLRMAA